ncbi:MAG: hypothetical protein RLZZ385_2773 [Pseudomonadota bacterium]
MNTPASPPTGGISHSAVAASDTQRALYDPATKARRRLRHFYDRAAEFLIATGGVGVIIAVLLIFVYLLYEVLPLFQSARVTKLGEFQLEQDTGTEVLHLAIEEQSEIGMQLGNNGQLVFFRISDGSPVDTLPIAIPAGDSITSFALNSEESGVFGVGLSSGKVMLAQYSYASRFDQDGVRSILPTLSYPYGEIPFELFEQQSVDNLAIRQRGDILLVAASNAQGQTELLRIEEERNLFSAFNAAGTAQEFDISRASLSVQVLNINDTFIDMDQRWLYFVTDLGRLSLVDIRPALAGQASSIETEVIVVDGDARPTEIDFLLGGISLMVADDTGTVTQWFLTNVDGNVRLEPVRNFRSDDYPIVDMTPEQRRKNFVTVDAAGYVGIFNSTAHRQVLHEQLVEGTPVAIAISPRGDTLLTETESGLVTVWDVHNEHPEVSWSALWGKVWYENYPEPDYIWQSSAATNDFEPKYSLTPLAFGTLKAAFYAMLLATPLAICGAIFTGYFMVPVMRRQVKPLVELMAALPTVVLGFLAGLWLAPFVETNLLGVFSLLIVLPLCILAASFVWMQLPDRLRHLVPDGWEAAILIPVIIVCTWLSFAMSTQIESWFFGGDLRSFLTEVLGITYDQRNALIVGLAMGFAVIPTIFSIAEDAIFTVPKQLTYGSLALGATPWQSLYRVVLPTASPGIFSAVMIGFGRAVGETMIVLMATGNTPIMDINIFEGMRTLAANIAVEVPESEVNSTHYRILFLAALVLFLFTFVFNTVAEIIRQSLRKKYSTI